MGIFGRTRTHTRQFPYPVAGTGLLVGRLFVPGVYPVPVPVSGTPRVLPIFYFTIPLTLIRTPTLSDPT